MLDAICVLPTKASQIENGNIKQITFSIFEFKDFSAEKIALYRHSLLCPVCLQPAYFRRASKDGKQACFGARQHLPDCSELNASSKKTVLAEKIQDPQEKENSPVEVIITESVENPISGFMIDFSSELIHKMPNNKNQQAKVIDNQSTNTD
ncbi:hypothetical protein E2R68_04065 [Psychromonas sp. RZ22]|uniref:hypothetical protein n=1 Tax=Psychromonas algarum TaxID=2555643 RepID=UPI0010688CC4|nr:hypothetical protein [Psychromonas sp. RZ22]TEW55571.1 hypothetical protein E2R68_04065 [Psychromonas sp. RZ22]